MNTSQNVNAAAVLNTLSPATVSTLEAHFRAQILSTLTNTLGSPVAAPVAAAATSDEAAPAKRGRKPNVAANLGPSGRAKAAKKGKRALSNNGLVAAAEIRAYDAKHTKKDGTLPLATDVVAYCESVGLPNVVPANVYNTRQLVKKAAEAAEAEAEAEEKAAKKTAKKTGRKVGRPSNAEKAAEAKKAAKKAAKKSAKK